MPIIADLLVTPGEFKPITDPDSAPNVLRYNGEICTGSRDKLIRWQEWYKAQ